MKSNKCIILIGTLILFFVTTLVWAASGTSRATTVESNAGRAASSEAVSNTGSAATTEAIGNAGNATTIMKPKIVVQSFAHTSAPLKEGNPVNLHIIFENKGLGKSNINATYKIACTVLTGGGPDEECPVPSTEMKFGKEILPGATHSVSLFGAIMAEAGKYKISIIIPGATGRPYSAILNVAPKMELKGTVVPIED